MNRIEIPFDIAREPDDVFAFLTDFSQLTRWRQLDSLRLEPEGSARVGTRLLSTVNPMGRRMEFTNEIVELDPVRRRYADRFLDGTFPIQSGWQVGPRDGGSRLLWTTEFEGRGLMALLTPILRRAIRRGQIEDLGKLKQILEGAGTP